MRAWQVQGKGEPLEVLKEVQLDPPVPGPGQMRIAVTAAGLGLPDVLMCRGVYPLTPPLPFTSGQEAAGVVTAVGEGVQVPIGTHVMAVTVFYEGHGSFAEECLVIADSAFEVPVGLTDAEAAGFWIPHMTGWIGLVDRGQLDEGESLVVLGAAGGSGIAAVQLGKALGARVIAVVSDEQKAEFCRGLGADVTINHHDEGFVEALKEAAGAGGVDVIYDPVGGDIAEAAATALGRGGRLLCVGFASGRWPVIDAHALVWLNAAVVGVLAGGSREYLLDVHASLSALISDGRLRNAVGPSVAFDELPNALQRLADREVIGKLVMVP
ncbi:MAG: NADPH:quinone oxidoreductase family protein [Mycobacterium sp.]|nr:NADPH:quinone oxidoreductase family protein [Mycobacterium sp.]